MSFAEGGRPFEAVGLVALRFGLAALGVVEAVLARVFLLGLIRIRPLSGDKASGILKPHPLVGPGGRNFTPAFE